MIHERTRPEHAQHAEAASVPRPSDDGRLVDASAARASPRRVSRRLNEPRPALVVATGGGVPRLVNRQSVAFVREEWRVVDRWWTDEPVHRRYFEVVLESGQNLVVFRDEERGGWYSQRGA
jgi:hypothetical protein